jgi:glycyl-tRNA synthetase beta chain
MKGHQRYFPVRNEDGDLEAAFVTLANRRPAQDQVVREGNERVLRARLNDAEFFWNEDSSRPLEELVPRLADVVFLGDLGNNLQRTDRLCELAGRIAGQVPGANPAHVQRAAYLCKADLLTGLVGEFPDLQGVVGREIALANGEPAVVAEAIAEHYQPAGADDDLPETLEGAVLSIADRIDVIVGCFALGMLPTGSQDPYALRRNALGILLILEKKDLDLRLGTLIDAAREVLADQGTESDAETAEQVREFFRDRLYHAAIERGYRHDFVRAVLEAGYDDVPDFWARLAALAECAGENWWTELVELVDRTYRIQRDAGTLRSVRDDLLEEPAEKALAHSLEQERERLETMFARGEYVSAADAFCSTFSTDVHDFFEEVFVNVDDEDVRMNRKSLLGHIYRLFAAHFADLYQIETADA